MTENEDLHFRQSFAKLRNSGYYLMYIVMIAMTSSPELTAPPVCMAFIVHSWSAKQVDYAFIYLQENTLYWSFM